jgi:biopolymer transport protein ExbD
MKKMSRRARRMLSRHERSKRPWGLNVISLMDIFTILVFFLLVNFSEVIVAPNAKTIELPESIAEQKPREAVVVMLTDGDIYVQDHRVGSMSGALNSAGSEIDALKVALKRQVARQLFAADDVDIDQQEVTIMAEKSIPFRLLKKVMLTCTKAGYGRISLSVLQKASQQG